MKINPLNAAVQRSIRSAPTLRAALESFLRNLARENATAIYSITISSNNVRLCRRQFGSAYAAKEIYTDLDFFIDLQNIISVYAGDNWFPQYIASRLRRPIGRIQWVFFPNTRFIFGQKNSWLELPRRYLQLPRQTLDISRDAAPVRSARREPAAKDTANFIYGLKRTLIEHSSEGYLGIDSAANLMCTSVRTLQRHLAQAGFTYSKLVEYARFEVAAEMLANPNLKIIEIAYTLGYEDPSHFSRAFRRIAGQSPREFRLVRLNKFEPA
jgi:AraC-like DNA-binding protein